MELFDLPLTLDEEYGYAAQRPQEMFEELGLVIPLRYKDDLII